MAPFLRSVIWLWISLGLVPVLFVLYHTFHFNDLVTIVEDSTTFRLMIHSFSMASLVTSAAMAIGTPLGLLFGKTDLPGRTTLLFLLAIPLLLPTTVYALAWRSGLDLLGLDDGWFQGFWGTSFVMTMALLPIPTLLTALFLKSVPATLEEAALLSTGWGRTIWHVTLPLLRPVLILSALLVFMLCLGEFGVPMLLHYDVFSVESFTRFSAFYDIHSATVAALPLAIAAMILAGSESILSRKRSVQLSARTLRHDALIISLKHPFMSTAMASSIVFFTTLLPLGAIVATVGRWDAWMEGWQLGVDALGRSLALASVGASFVLFFGYFIGYAFARRVILGIALVDLAAFFLFALPGTVLGIALIALFNRPGLDVLYGSWWLPIIGYIAKYTLLSERICTAAVLGTPLSMEDAARLSGAGWLASLRYILLPMHINILTGAWFVAFLFILRDTGVTMILYPPGGDTLPVRLLTMMANGAPAVVAALALMTTVTVLLSALFFTMALRLHTGRRK